MGTWALRTYVSWDVPLLGGEGASDGKRAPAEEESSPLLGAEGSADVQRAMADDASSPLHRSVGSAAGDGRGGLSGATGAFPRSAAAPQCRADKV